MFNEKHSLLKSWFFLVEIDMVVQNNSIAIYVYIWGVFLSLDENAINESIEERKFLHSQCTDLNKQICNFSFTGLSWTELVKRHCPPIFLPSLLSLYKVQISKQCKVLRWRDVTWVYVQFASPCYTVAMKV